MFSFIPDLQLIETQSSIDTLPQAFQIYHSTVNDVQYRSIGEERSAETHCIFHYTVKGRGEVVYHGKAYSTSAGEGFFNIINESDSGYGYPEDGTQPWEFVVVSFKGGNVREIVRELIENRVVYNLSKDTDQFCRMCKELMNSSNTHAQITFLTKLITLIVDSNNTSSYLTERFKYIVKRDVLKNPTIDAIAREMNISREHLQREYRNQMGVSPAKYLRDRRFEKLCSLLSTSLTENEIAKEMNFPSVSGMAIFFKSITGITPRQYRSRGYFI